MSEFKKYINSILNNLVIDSKSKQDIADEIEDHLILLKQEYMCKGYSEKEATELAVKRFGEANKIKHIYGNTFSSFNKIIRILAAILFVPYMLLFIYKAFFYWVSYAGGEWQSINLVPFKTMSFYLSSYNNINYHDWFQATFGMIIAFIPFGFLISIISTRIKRVYDIALIAFIFSLIVEILQYILKTGVSDIDDVIMATLGSILGYSILKLLLKFVIFLKKVVSKLKIVES